MATEQNKTLRRAKADDDVKHIVAALADLTKTEVVESNLTIRDMELKRIVQTENLAATLGAVLESMQPKKTEAPKEETAEPKAKKVK